MALEFRRSLLWMITSAAASFSVWTADTLGAVSFFNNDFRNCCRYDCQNENGNNYICHDKHLRIQGYHLGRFLSALSHEINDTADH